MISGMTMMLSRKGYEDKEKNMNSTFSILLSLIKMNTYNI